MLYNLGVTAFICLLCYAVGSIPVGYIVARYAGVADIREHGSGNIGATNVARTLGKFYFLPVFILDMLKAYGTLSLVMYVSAAPYLFYAASASYLLGNGYSWFLNGTGGKGVAATVGILAAYNPMVLMATMLVFGATVAGTRTVGIASVCSALAAPVIGIMSGLPWHGIIFLTGIAAWIVFRHTENIKAFCS